VLISWLQPSTSADARPARYRKIGRAEQGLKALSVALAAIERTGDRLFEAELRRLNGELLTLGDTFEGGLRSVEAAAAECFHRTIQAARQQGARLLELRATTSLARLLQKQGKPDEARAMPADIYGWFTEGFDTADLRDAKTLLEELRA
jgi:hypothetical protein